MSKDKKTVVLVGGCFDILHPGHIIFLTKAKKLADKLIVILESDEKVNRLKGFKRPIHTQKDRAKVLLALKSVDRVISLPFMDQPSQYDSLIVKIKPDIIATTKDSPDNYHKARTAKLVGAKLKLVTDRINNYSTSEIVSQNQFGG